MTWKSRLDEGSVQRHMPSAREVADLRGVIDRNLADAALTSLSADNRLGIAYEAVLVACKLAVHASGYRIRSGIPGAHAITLECGVLAMGKPVADVIDYFDTVRRKRNHLSYDAAGTVSHAEANEALKHARGVKRAMEAWLADRHSELL